TPSFRPVNSFTNATRAIWGSPRELRYAPYRRGRKRVNVTCGLPATAMLLRMPRDPARNGRPLLPTGRRFLTTAFGFGYPQDDDEPLRATARSRGRALRRRRRRVRAHRQHAQGRRVGDARNDL